MGRILFSKGKYKEASELFTEMYQMARAVKDPLLVNTAKVNLGVARGMAMKGGYLRAVREDLPALLAWKSSQEPFLGKEEFMP